MVAKVMGLAPGWVYTHTDRHGPWIVDAPKVHLRSPACETHTVPY
jgi:hypothetical protein